jgi:4-hydroxybenzoyl-CoA reductase subunit beta
MTSARLLYHAPETLERAVALLAEHGPGAVPLGGGTDLVPALKYGVCRPDHLVSLRRIGRLRQTEATAAGDCRIGAAVTLADVAASSPVRAACPAVAEAAAQAGSPLLRNRGTLGGNVCLDTRCWYYNQTEAWRASRPLCQKAGGDLCYVNEKQNRCVALFSADTPPALMVARAQATLLGPRGERTVPVDALYSGDGLRPLAKAEAEIVASVTVPAAPPRSGAAYVKYSVRDSIDFPVVGAAAAVELDAGGALAAARVAVTGVAPAPLRLAAVEDALRGRAAPPDGDPALAAAAVGSLGPLFLSDAVPHKRRLVGLMTVEAVRRAAARARGGADA